MRSAAPDQHERWIRREGYRFVVSWRVASRSVMTSSCASLSSVVVVVVVVAADDEGEARIWSAAAPAAALPAASHAHR